MCTVICIGILFIGAGLVMTKGDWTSLAQAFSGDERMEKTIIEVKEVTLLS